MKSREAIETENMFRIREVVLFRCRPDTLLVDAITAAKATTKIFGLA